MQILAILENKNRRLRAYLPEFISPFRACMTRHCTVHDDQPCLVNSETYKCAYELSHGTSANCNYVNGIRDDVDIYMLVQTDITDATGLDNVPKNAEGYLVLSISLRTLFSQYGRKLITETTSWTSVLNKYTQAQMLQAYVNLPIPATVVDMHDRSTTGLATLNPVDGELNWDYPTGITYLDFNQAFKRPQAYTLDHLPGITAHYSNAAWPDIEDKLQYMKCVTDIVIDKDISCTINFENCIPIVNGLMYRFNGDGTRFYIYGAADLFLNQSFLYASVMLLDFSEMVTGTNKVSSSSLFDCNLVSLTHNGSNWEIIFTVPDTKSLDGNSIFLSFDGRLIQQEKVSRIGSNLVSVVLSDREIQYMKERDMQLTERVVFNTRYMRLRNNTEQWIRAQFNDVSAEDLESIRANLEDTVLKWDSLSEKEKEVLIASSVIEPDGGNSNRSFLLMIPNENIYVHDYIVNTRLGNNSLLVNGNFEGLLQSVRGQEIFEHVICSYMDMRSLTPTDWFSWRNGATTIFTKEVNPTVGSSTYTSYKYEEDAGVITATALAEVNGSVTSITVDDIVYTKVQSDIKKLLYGSDAHLLGYAPYEFLTTLETHRLDETSKEVTLLSTPYVDNIAPEAVALNSNEFRLIDLVCLA